MSPAMREFLRRAEEHHWKWAERRNKLELTHPALDKPFFITLSTSSRSRSLIEGWTKMQRLLAIQHQLAHPEAHVRPANPVRPAGVNASKKRNSKPSAASNPPRAVAEAAAAGGLAATAPAAAPGRGQNGSGTLRLSHPRAASYQPPAVVERQTFTPQQLLAWALAVSRLRAHGHDWSTVRAMNRRFRDDPDYQRTLYEAMQRSTVAEFLELRRRLQKRADAGGLWARLSPETQLALALAQVQWRRQMQRRAAVQAPREAPRQSSQQPTLPAAYAMLLDALDEDTLEVEIEPRRAAR